MGKMGKEYDLELVIRTGMFGLMERLDLIQLWKGLIEESKKRKDFSFFIEIEKALKNKGSSNWEIAQLWSETEPRLLISFLYQQLNRRTTQEVIEEINGLAEILVRQKAVCTELQETLRKRVSDDKNWYLDGETAIVCLLLEALKRRQSIF